MPKIKGKYVYKFSPSIPWHDNEQLEKWANDKAELGFHNITVIMRNGGDVVLMMSKWEKEEDELRTL